MSHRLGDNLLVVLIPLMALMASYLTAKGTYLGVVVTFFSSLS